MAYWFHLGSIVLLVGVLMVRWIWSGRVVWTYPGLTPVTSCEIASIAHLPLGSSAKSKPEAYGSGTQSARSTYPRIFVISTTLCLIELALWPLCLKHPMLWYCLEIVTVTSRVATAIEAIRRGWDAWIITAGAMFAGSAVLLAWWRPMQANLWFPILMRARGFLWLGSAVVLVIVAAHQWTLLSRPGRRWRWHISLLAVYFAEHAAFAFHMGPWFQAVETHEWVSALIYLSFAAVWVLPMAEPGQKYRHE